MKNIVFFKEGILLMILCLASVFIMAQQSQVVIGEVRNGVATITKSSEAVRVLKGGLSSSAQISNLKLEWVGGAENRYYLVGNVAGDYISAKAISLTQEGGVLLAIGPGVEITCTGYKCSSCRIEFQNWKPNCVCDASMIYSDTRCDMISKVVIGF